jgi:hypothetical protein
MILIEEQDNYKDAPIYAVSEYKYANENVNPVDVITGLIGKGTQLYQSGKGAAETLSGQGTATTNIGGYDVTFQGDTSTQKKKGVATPLIIVGGITILAVVGLVVYYKKSKK